MPAAERAEAPRTRSTGWPTQVAEHVDLTAVLRDRRTRRPTCAGDRLGPGRRAVGSGAASGDRPVVAMAGGRAFTFRYAETDELLRAAGLRAGDLRPARPTTALPAGTAGLYLGGGFPEVHAAELAGERAAARRARGGDRGRACRPSPSAPGCSTCAARVDGAPMVGAIDADGGDDRRG